MMMSARRPVPEILAQKSSGMKHTEELQNSAVHPYVYPRAENISIFALQALLMIISEC